MKNILLIATGGTIAATSSGTGLIPTINSDELIRFVPEVKDMCNIDAIQPISIDSTNIQPEDWAEIAVIIRDVFDAYDGFVITHGTDTMAYGAAVLSYLIQNPGKTIVFTGAQKPINLDITDAKMNLRDAVSYACKGNPGVYIVFNGKVILGTRARKTKTKSYDAFESINFPVAAFIDGNRITSFFKCTGDTGKPSFHSEIFPHVFLLKLSPGMEPDVLDYISDKYEAIVIESYGTGGVPFSDKRNFLAKVKAATEKGKTIVVATQVMLEGSDLGTYEVGTKALEYNVLQAYDMTVEAAIAKLMWILSITDEFSEIKRLFYTTVHDDILYSAE